NPSPNISRLRRANQSRHVCFREAPRAFDAPPVSQRQRESRPGLLRGNRNPHQFRLPFQTPVIQRAHRDAVLGAILPPRHPACRVSLDQPPLLFFARHAAIVQPTASPFKRGSLDAYGPTTPALTLVDPASKTRWTK